MKIQVLGTGCPKCQKLEKNVFEAVAQLGIDVEIVKISQITEIMSFGVMVTPALAFDGVVVSSGKINSVNEIIQFIKEHQ
ncbi:MAG TPA: thioredoxin family protein [Caldisericia bacterium]|mgnify:CR=1 FL=1|nr:thioredoxin family protein [Caldisericia bacterium]HPF48566.1 thioredoxin family protein [Caldisericia bacterium]HPI83774.1 thioredoxin family protein [Caldisericia bacterium]HPQ93021.1 thioredoxin family protein [Caldisericia bacterium]HRV75146.1 thioredoxin family protein [Caldisericia bacterium]